jgi:peptide/nickel transport system substrate-binding protein
MTSRERLAFYVALAIIIISGATLSVLWIRSHSYVTGDVGGELREGIASQPVMINPVTPITEADRDISQLVYSNVNDVADSVTLSPDNRTYTVRLKQNVFWSDGERLTADDVIFTVQMIQDPSSDSPLYRSFEGVQVSRVSALEVNFSLPAPYAFFQQDQLQNLLIIPKHIFADIPVQNWHLSVYSLKPVGSGQYVAKDYTTASDGTITSVTLAANNNYFGATPNISTVEFKFYQDPQSLAAAYNTGQIDSFGLSTYDPVISDLAVRYKAYYLNSYRYYAIFINPATAPQQLQNPDVRYALSQLIDRTALVNNVLGGHGQALYGPTTLAQNPVQGGSSTSTMALLQGLSLQLTVPDDPFLVKTADIIQGEWAAAGINISLNVLPTQTIQEDTLQSSDYSLLLFGNITDSSQDLFAFWDSSQRFYPDQNLSLYDNPAVDANLEQYRSTFDSTQRAQLLNTISNQIASDMPAIFLYSPDYAYIATPTLGGFGSQKEISVASDRFSDIANWYVNTKRVFN